MTPRARLIVTGERIDLGADRCDSLAITFGSAPIPDAFRAAVTTAAAGRAWIDVVLAGSDIYPIRFDRRPLWLRRSLSTASPLELSHIVWSGRHQQADGTAIVIARRDRLDAIATWLSNNGLPTPRFIDPHGVVIGRDPAHAARNATISVVLAALLSVPGTTAALRTWRAAPLTPAETRPNGAADAFPGVAPTPTLAATIVAIAGDLPAGATLVSAASTVDGRLVLTIDSPDPDALRATMRARPALRRLREEAQRSTDRGGLRITYAEPPGPVGSAASRTATPAQPAGSDGFRARLARDAAAVVVAIDFAPAPAGSGPIATGLTAVGPQAAILALADRIETRPPAARLLSWTLAHDPAGARLTGVAALR